MEGWNAPQQIGHHVVAREPGKNGSFIDLNVHEIWADILKGVTWKVIKNHDDYRIS